MSKSDKEVINSNNEGSKFDSNMFDVTSLTAAPDEGKIEEGQKEGISKIASESAPSSLIQTTQNNDTPVIGAGSEYSFGTMEGWSDGAGY